MDLIPVAARRMPIMREGKRVMVEPGDPVPEAAAWSHVKAWERQGYIRWVPAPPDLAAKMKDQAVPPDGQPPDPGDASDSGGQPAVPEPEPSATDEPSEAEEKPQSNRKKRGKAKADATSKTEG